MSILAQLSSQTGDRSEYSNRKVVFQCLEDPMLLEEIAGGLTHKNAALVGDCAEVLTQVAAPDGRLAGYCLCTVYREENQRSGRNQGSTDPVAVHPDFQGLGLARALLLSGLRLLKARGVETAVLGTSSENLAMQRAAQAVGFKVQSETVWFSKVLQRRGN